MDRGARRWHRSAPEAKSVGLCRSGLPAAAADPKTCKHLNVDHRGSKKARHVTFCKDCLTVVEEIPQEEYRLQQVEARMKDGRGMFPQDGVPTSLSGALRMAKRKPRK